MAVDRRVAINEYIDSQGEVKLSQLALIFPDVSSMTLRRDLEYLEENNKIIRTRGGAMSIKYIKSKKEEIYTKRELENIQAKNLIAQKAIKLIDGRRSLYLDSGTTVNTLAKLIETEQELSVVTSSPVSAMEMAKNPNASVTVMGGRLNNDTFCITGQAAMDLASSINIDVAIMGTSGFSPKAGFTAGYLEECNLKREIIRKAKTVIVLMDSSKVNKDMIFTFAAPEDIDILVTDGNLDDETVKELQKYNVEIV